MNKEKLKKHNAKYKEYRDIYVKNNYNAYTFRIRKDDIVNAIIKRLDNKAITFRTAMMLYADIEKDPKLRKQFLDKYKEDK